MREVILTAESAAGDADRTKLLQEFENLRKQGGSGIYRIYYMDDGGELYILMTTSKDVNLALSTLSMWAQAYLCHFFEEECGKADTANITFSIPQEGDPPEVERKRRLYVAMTKSAKSTVFHISPVR